MADSTLKRISDICLSLPDTKLTMPWGAPHFRVGEKIFCGYGGKKGQPTIDLKLEMEHADILVHSDPRFTSAPYVGHKGWVSMDAKAIKDWDEVRALVLESYRLIAPKKTLAKLDAAPASVRKTSPKKPR
jgi:predicted DNA-binding protein (MmcQ/YjbR family)